ncbi:MAG: hypothetical protein CMC05_03090 [Flavobacteriaceae bacterium]|nr:hypothetical protein [Flavobacteriaceae bacterium]MBD09795.1 hypothetical protein [Flavobacteriaceae bacterium]|tara:strand:+ start:2704 stop:3516 length:813 start_codon:yes stop_codon:yes gene_type:complete
MKYILLFLLSVISLNTYSQDYPKNTKHIKTIHATVYKKKDTIDYRKSVTYYDEDWNVLTNTNTLSSALDKGSETVTILDTKKKFVQAILTSRKDTLDYIVYLFDDNGNRTNYYQIRKGDTLNDQKRTYDKNGNNLELYNKKNGKYFLRFEAKYNDENKIISRHYYNPLHQLVKIQKFEYSQDGKSEKYYTTDKKGNLELNTETIEIAPRKFKKTYYYDSKGINYGITLETKKGGYKIEEKDENDKLVSIEIFDKRDRLTTSVYINYTEVN